ncbi:MAG: hypothetical protein R3F30_06345 [Planctomycetota bacterium]
MEAPARPRTRPLAWILLAAAVALVAAPQVLFLADPGLLARILAVADVVLAHGLQVVLLGLLPLLVLLLVLNPVLWWRFRAFVRRYRQRLEFDEVRAQHLYRTLHEHPSALNLLEFARLLCEAHRYPQALPFLAAALEKDDKDPWIHHYLARCFQALDLPQKAFEHASQAFLLDPDLGTGENLLLTDELALAIGNAQVGYNLADRFHTLYGDSIRGLLYLARALHDLGRQDEAHQALRKLLDLGPSRGRRYLPEEHLARIAARRALARGVRP